MKSVFFVLLIFLALPVTSQIGLAEENRLFVYHFDFHEASEFQNALPWEQLNGELRFKGGDPKRDYTNLFSQKVVPDFRLEVRSIWTSGSPNDGFGIVFRYLDPNNYFAFQIRNDGRFRVYKMLKGVVFDIVPWKCNSLLVENAVNTLSVLCIGDKQRLYINSSLAAVIIDKDFSQNAVNIGVISHGDVLCSFDDLVVEGVTSKEKAPFTDTPSKKVDFAYSSQGFSLQPPWRIEFGRLFFIGGPENEYINIPFDEYRKPLTISVRTNWIGKSKTDGFGLIFNYKDDTTFNVFLITGQGDYQVGRKFYGQWSDLVALKKNPPIKEKINYLGIEYAEKSVDFLINGSVKIRIPSNELTDTGYVKTGLFAKGSVRCSFDDFTVKEVSPAPKN